MPIDDRNLYRKETYLENYEFYPNNIQFRVGSSKMIEQWKNVQSFQLNELANGKYFFKPQVREILLLKYDMWSRWINEIENYFIEILHNKRKEIDEKHIYIVLYLAEKTNEKYNDIIFNKHPEFFDQKFVKIWKEIHSIAFDFFKTRIIELKNKSVGFVFSELITELIELMQYSIIELYELDDLICKVGTTCNECGGKDICPTHKIEENSTDTIPFLIYESYSKKSYINNSICLLTKRSEVYKKYFNLNKTFIKNYTEHSIPPKILDNLESMNIEIDYKKSLSYWRL